MQAADIPMVLALSLSSFVALAVLTRLMGNRQMSQLTMMDYVVGISIGSIAAEMAARPDADNWFGLIAMAVYAGLAILLNVLNDKSLRVRALVLGKPTVLWERGTLYYNNLRGAKMDLTEFLTQCRQAGYFDLSQLELVLLEVNGKLSFLPVEGARPLTPADMGMTPKQSRPAIPVVMDGALLSSQLRLSGNDESWLQKQLAAQGYAELDDILLATVDADNALAVYEKNEDKDARVYFR